MSTPTQHSSSADPEDQKDTKKIKKAEDKAATGSAKADSSFTLISPDEVEITMTNVVPEPSKNTFIMKDHRGENMQISLDFGNMRDGPPSTDDEDSGEERGTDMPIMSIAKRIVLVTRFSQIMGSHFLSQRVMNLKEAGGKIEAAATQINKATVPENSVPNKYRHRRQGVAGKIRLRGQ